MAATIARTRAGSPDTVDILIRVPREEIVALSGLLETYDDLALAKTLDPATGLAVLMTGPGQEETLRALLDSLAREYRITLADPSAPDVAPFLEKIHALD
jgi:hypothetical protein